MPLQIDCWVPTGLRKQGSNWMAVLRKPSPEMLKNTAQKCNTTSGLESVRLSICLSVSNKSACLPFSSYERHSRECLFPFNRLFSDSLVFQKFYLTLREAELVVDWPLPKYFPRSGQWIKHHACTVPSVYTEPAILDARFPLASEHRAVQCHGLI